MAGITDKGRKEHWEPGETAHFEYHCYESMDSQDSDLWLRSHSKVKILGMADWEEEIGKDMTVQERVEEGILKVYQVRFADGHEGEVLEDELYSDPEYWHGDDPPERLKKKHGISL